MHRAAGTVVCSISGQRGYCGLPNVPPNSVHELQSQENVKHKEISLNMQLGRTSIRNVFVVLVVLTAGFTLYNIGVLGMSTLSVERYVQYFSYNSSLTRLKYVYRKLKAPNTSRDDVHDYTTNNVTHRLFNHQKVNTTSITHDDPHVKSLNNVTHRFFNHHEVNTTSIAHDDPQVKSLNNVTHRLFNHHEVNTTSITHDDRHVMSLNNVTHRLINHSLILHMSDHRKQNRSQNTVPDSQHETNRNVSPHMLDFNKLNVSNIPDYETQHTTYSTVAPGLLPHKPNVTNIPGKAVSLCPQQPPGLVGPIGVDRSVHQLDVLEKRYFPTRPGGHFKPANCTSRTKVAIIVPYRNRKQHLLIFLNNLIPLLIKQQAEFAIFFIEPVPSLTFNRALLMNIGFVEALKTDNFTCFVFHDVDLIPENDMNLYRCENNPRHMSAAVSKFNYKLPYKDIAGGVISISKSVFKDINGMSNLFFGWGGEDDDLAGRFPHKNYKMLRYPMHIARYLALNHKEDLGNPRNPKRFRLLNIKKKTPNGASQDGLNSLMYKVVTLEEERPLYTWILIDTDMNYYNKRLSDVLHQGS